MLQMSQILWILWGKMIVKHQFFSPFHQIFFSFISMMYM